MKFIGYRAFYGCEELEEIVIPDNVTNIDTKAYSDEAETFVGCAALKSATIGGVILTIHADE